MFLQILLLLGLSALFLYWLAVRHTAFWRKRGIPGPVSVPIKGNLDQLFGQKPAVLQFREWTKMYGPVYGIQEGRINVLVTSDPEMVRQMLVEKFELFHGRLVSPDATPPYLAKSEFIYHLIPWISRNNLIYGT